MSYSVNFHPLAQADYDHIFAYIYERSQDGALHWDEALDHAIAALSKDPHIYSRIPDPVVTDHQYRQIHFKTKYGNKYRAVFAVEGEQVTVLRIRGLGQQLLHKADIPKG